VFEDFKTGAITSLAVVNIGRAGVTFNELEVVILSSFTGNEETTEQIIARALNKDIEGKIADIHIITSTEEAEIKKLNKALSSFDTKNIIWVK
jgi:superfamily II DNA or RNA helicase